MARSGSVPGVSEDARVSFSGFFEFRGGGWRLRRRRILGLRVGDPRLLRRAHDDDIA